jgi:hypothetical protein
MSDLAPAPAARQTVTMRARLAAAGLTHAPADPAQSPPETGAGKPASARVAEARSRAGERRYRQRQMLRPLGWAFIAVVVISPNSHPAAGLTDAAGNHTPPGYVVAAAVA